MMTLVAILGAMPSGEALEVAGGAIAGGGAIGAPLAVFVYNLSKRLSAQEAQVSKHIEECTSQRIEHNTRMTVLEQQAIATHDTLDEIKASGNEQTRILKQLVEAIK